MTKIAIIGTAGRDKTKPMTAALWSWMVDDAMQRVPKGAHLVSGGAAWADHLAVELYINGHAEDLTLHLPAPFQQVFGRARFVGDYGTSGGTANYYHQKFSEAIGHGTLNQILQVLQGGASYTAEPEAKGYGAMFARNKKVALGCDRMLAYTFGEGLVPADGGTKDTWDQFMQLHLPHDSDHVTLPLLY